MWTAWNILPSRPLQKGYSAWAIGCWASLHRPTSLQVLKMLSAAVSMQIFLLPCLWLCRPACAWVCTAEVALALPKSVGRLSRTLERQPAIQSLTMRQSTDSIVPAILVFGASGTAGSAVCEAIRRTSPKTRIYGFVRDKDKAQVTRQIHALFNRWSDSCDSSHSLRPPRHLLALHACKPGL